MLDRDRDEDRELKLGRLDRDEPDLDLLKLRDVFELERPDDRDLRAAVQTSTWAARIINAARLHRSRQLLKWRSMI